MLQLPKYPSQLRLQQQLKLWDPTSSTANQNEVVSVSSKKAEKEKKRPSGEAKGQVEEDQQQSYGCFSFSVLSVSVIRSPLPIQSSHKSVWIHRFTHQNHRFTRPIGLSNQIGLDSPICLQNLFTKLHRSLKSNQNQNQSNLLEVGTHFRVPSEAFFWGPNSFISFHGFCCLRLEANILALIGRPIIFALISLDSFGDSELRSKACTVACTQLTVHSVVSTEYGLSELELCPLQKPFEVISVIFYQGPITWFRKRSESWMLVPYHPFQPILRYELGRLHVHSVLTNRNMSSSIITYDFLRSAMSLYELRGRKGEKARDRGREEIMPSKNASVLVKGKAKVSKTFKKIKTFLGAKKKTKSHLTIE
nr:hypothetical protein CFP56_45283 [Quercus suber]